MAENMFLEEDILEAIVADDAVDVFQDGVENMDIDEVDEMEWIMEDDPAEFREVQHGCIFYGQEFVFRRLPDPTNPLEILTEKEIREKYRFYMYNIYIIVDYVTPMLEQRRKRGPALPPLIQVVLFLRYLATGSIQDVVADIIRVSGPTICRTVHRVALAIVDTMEREFVYMPDQDECYQIMREFKKMAGFPFVIGCIDCTHVRIIRPPARHPEYVDRNNQYSLNVQAVCDHKQRIRDIVACWPGSVHDARIFRQSKVFTRYLEPMRGPGQLLGDSGYACLRRCLTPFRNNRVLTEAEDRYQDAHTHTRVLIEQTFGVLKRRFSMLAKCMNFRPTRCATMIKAAAILHNFAVRQRDEILEKIRPLANIYLHDPEEIPPPDELINDDVGLNGGLYRQQVINQYFT